MNKNQLRKHFRDLRKHIPLIERENAARNAASIFIRQNEFNQADHFACYMAFNEELDLQPLIDEIWHAGKHCYLPVLMKMDGKSLLRFAAYKPGDALHPNRYGILEPDLDAHALELTKMDVVLTPLIAFDRQGHRLGTGGGYYDQTLGELPEKKPIIIGTGFALQEADHVPSDPWDVQLNAILTENEFTRLARGK